MHQLPPKPDYFRVKVWRRLQRIGAVAIKNSVYALPQSDQSFEHFQWLVKEIVSAGGEASVCDAAFVDGLSDGQIEALFRAARSTDYAAAADEAEALLRTIPAARSLDAVRRGEIESDLGRIHRRMVAIAAIDFFGAPARRLAEEALRRVDGKMRTPSKRRAPPGSKAAPARKSGRTWVTRHGVYIDRIASAWLIRRFIDERARFRFVEESGPAPRPNEVRFDMFEAEYTHEGDRCTFEVLLDRFALSHQGLQALGEMVHDIDLEDSKFGRPETAGLQRIIDGIRRRHTKDEERIEQGARVLDAIYQSLEGDGIPTRPKAAQ
ncbi:MAG: chromate resistance protein ChrB domain-containing protein [Gemmatimonadales bacterium]